MSNQKTLHVVTVSFVINHFFGNQFRYLNSLNNNDYYLACSPSDELFELSSKLGFTAVPVNITREISPFSDLVSIFKLYLFIRRNKIDSVIGHTPKGGLVAMVAAFLAGVENRFYFRHGIIYETSSGLKRKLLKGIEKLTGRLANQIICVSNDVKKISERDGLNANYKNMLLGLGTCNGIDVNNKFNPDKYSDSEVTNLRERLGISEDSLVVGYVGRIVRDKGINELVSAWKLLKQKYTNIVLLLVGPIEERDSISSDTISIIRNDNTIINTGFVLDSSLYFKLMNLFILPTYREGFPTVSLEASSMRLPVLITKATGCKESIIEGVTGLFVKNDPSDIATQIDCYLQNESMRLLHGGNGRKFVSENFDQEKIWNEIHNKLNY
ncbi:glycosyltransferase family 4 protein [Sphingobacterium hotanense]|uniref:Glycosyltransferase family 4 protein n=1 Tax=Sphingobacterium hotanense TaxID=649196 RepID=A0ABT7NL69_9SPHI|nr:glycosyltransferase family 4 protein [Sphingobacterium hotanense]MDM1047942.1 glycosyltransferase family 4 protein [Sphingobacterium hotanense]